ncbi:Dabb family protein [Limimaricola pyoseonensis]|uniref:Stress responsive A/B Barrel Domain n=1 Tax=Limimaricola pyoseonensis TaxID=521013 RepID=A0A1G7HMI0_9RHOB|nr:Dabb family protein [Limimaricola pyoseonensis]SDF01690.1 Stress responsive A/B Barrel Domain [Limimaricola pyoseonensis]
MIRHIVLVRFAPGTGEAEIAALWEELHAIEGRVPGLLSIASGRSESPEGIERGYLHGFTADFADWDALAAYQAHPDHVRFGQNLTAHAEGGRDGILVFDLPVAAR